MKYKYTVKEDNSDLSSGRVLYSLPGASAFPIRLMSEIFQFCCDHLGLKDKVIIYDPCCGSAYHLTALGFLHSDKINKIICSDINEEILNFAKKNLALLNLEGIDKRITEIGKMSAEFNKDSHKEALKSAKRLRNNISNNTIETKCFSQNILSADAIKELNNEHIDIIFADIPYENLESWQGTEAGSNEIEIMLDNLLKIVNPDSLVVIASTKKQIVEHGKYSRVKKMTIGKRKITILKLGK
ncbi:MAG: hypothetical protein KAS62_12515 [Candidatus Delongbacteria bacterium]|nr:hypothetical protein [Candidatus Delongbacteria bacterium]